MDCYRPDVRRRIMESVREGGELVLSTADLEGCIDLELVKYLDLGVETSEDEETIAVRSQDLKALLYILYGGDPESVSQHISWRSFESLTATYLKLHEYDVATNVRGPPPRGFEIDVLAVNTLKRIALVIDCKHWNVNRFSSLAKAASDLRDRVVRAGSRCFILARKLASFSRARYMYPAIVTLRSGDYIAVEGVPIIPIFSFPDFLNNIDAYLEELQVKRYDNPCYVEGRRKLTE